MYFMPKWKDPGRKRNCHADHKSPDYVKYYDLDLEDFTDLVLKVKDNQRLTTEEDDRYAMYVYTIIYIVQENPKFKNKPMIERAELFEQGVLELLQALPKFEKDRGSSIYSFAYRCCYVSFIHYYESKKQNYLKQQEIMKHCNEELDDYLYEFSTHKVSNNNKEE